MPTRRVVAAAVLALAPVGPGVYSQTSETGGATVPTPLATQTIGEDLYLIAGAGCNILLFDGPDGAVLIDSGNAADAPRTLAALDGLAAHPVRFVINTHGHPDHVGGNPALAGRGAITVAHDAARAWMSEERVVAAYGLTVPAAPAAGLPVVTFGDTARLHLGDARVTLVHVDAAHSSGDVIVWIGDADVVHMGDTYYAGTYPFIDVASGGSLAGLVAAIEIVLSRATADTVIVPGHGRVSDRTELAEYRDMLVAVGRSVSDLVSGGSSREEVVEARPTERYDARYGSGGVSPERFVRTLYEDLATRR